MAEHDPLCPVFRYPRQICECFFINKARADERERIAPMMKALSEELLNARADERERIAAAIEADPLPEYEEVAYRDGFDAGQYRAARIARNGGSDDA